MTAYGCLHTLQAQTLSSGWLDNYSFDTFECVFGYEGTLREIRSILAFQKVVVGDTRAAIMGLKDERHIRILEKVHAGQAHFRVLRKAIAHAKLYLLSARDGRRRVVIGSANLSEQAFSGNQSETLVVVLTMTRQHGPTTPGCLMTSGTPLRTKCRCPKSA